MFNKKTMSSAVAAAATGMSLGKVLGVAGVAATAAGFSMGAAAQINVSDSTAPGSVAIANESVTPTTSGTLPVGSGDTNGVLNVTGDLGIGVAASDQVFVRFDWTGAELSADLALTSISVTAGTGTVPVNSTSLTDGSTGDSQAIFGVTADTNGFAQTSTVLLDIGTSGIGLTGSSSDVRVRVFETQTNAINETLALSDQSVTGAISLGDALSVVFSDEDATAEVTKDFLEFDSGVTGTLGSFTASASTNFVLATGLAAITTLDDLVDTGTSSVVTYSGDFSFATQANAYFVGTSSSCATVGAGLTVDTSTLTTATINDVDTANGQPLCVTVNGTTETIPLTTYTAEVSLVHDVTSSSPAATVDEDLIGNIVRNGTTVEVAYLTTFTDYNQRLLINSRHPVAAEYKVTFQTEDGVTATPLAAAEGTLQPNENLVLRAIDLVTLTGGTRCSATVTVVAPSGNISVATTQVNLSDASTDTVSYN